MLLLSLPPCGVCRSSVPLVFNKLQTHTCVMMLDNLHTHVSVPDNKSPVEKKKSPALSFVSDFLHYTAGNIAWYGFAQLAGVPTQPTLFTLQGSTSRIKILDRSRRVSRWQREGRAAAGPPGRGDILIYSRRVLNVHRSTLSPRARRLRTLTHVVASHVKPKLKNPSHASQ